MAHLKPKKEKTTILAKEENIIPSKTLDNATENKVENLEFEEAAALRNRIRKLEKEMSE